MTAETKPLRSAIGEAVSFAWAETDSFIVRRFVLTLLLVFGTAALAALGPIALKYAVDGFASLRNDGFSPGASAGAHSPETASAVLTPTAFLGLYIAALWISRSLGEARWLLFGTADQHLHRRLSRRLLAHIIDLNLIPESLHARRYGSVVGETILAVLLVTATCRQIDLLQRKLLQMTTNGCRRGCALRFRLLVDRVPPDMDL